MWKCRKWGWQWNFFTQKIWKAILKLKRIGDLSSDTRKARPLQGIKQFYLVSERRHCNRFWTYCKWVVENGSPRIVGIFLWLFYWPHQKQNFMEQFLCWQTKTTLLSFWNRLTTSLNKFLPTSTLPTPAHPPMIIFCFSVCLSKRPDREVEALPQSHGRSPSPLINAISSSSITFSLYQYYFPYLKKVPIMNCL